jgi:hypothetical protein
MNARHAALSLLFCLCLSPALASAQEPVTECVSLGGDQEIVRGGDGEEVFLRNGDAHYRLGFSRNCGAVLMTRTITISTDDQADRLCPSGSKVRARQSTCQIATVEAISSEDFAKHKQRHRR